ncbi:MAG: DNA gyrase/topoisomerase IV subunit A [Paludibacteraceae bacterium]|nr:DNA gyrase/topoisomerase IV subunit A [Paludibacteraceae bacterium]
MSEESVKYHLTGMYKDWFLDYASHVILERAVPAVEDGLKPVQRRILHAMKGVDDGKYNKVANIVGQTMQYHPHGDASIGDALVQLGQKNLLIDCQGNWGNILTGDGAAAPRYIEARLSKFALETVFNPKTTEWMFSYDGRKKEPVHLPVKFPLLLAQGVEGIAVGLNSKILPHNFVELCDAALACLHGEEFVLYPDFPTGGEIDVSRYNDGERGGMVKIRSRITKADDNKTLVISQVPYGTTTSKIIETILKAQEKGKIKIKKVDDFTAEEARIVVQLAPGASSDKTIDALYAFTDCEVSVSPNCCVIQDNKPVFTTVSELLRQSVETTKGLLRRELEIQKAELEEQYFFTSLERIFIEQRIYKEKGYEDAPDKEKLIQFTDKALEPFKPKLLREVKREDIERLFEIRMIRITRFDSKKADELMRDLDKRIKQTQHDINHLTDYAIRWYEHLKDTYGARYPRLTEVRNFASINVKTVVEANEKLYINREEGFIGTGLKKDEFLCNCSDIDDIIVFHKDGRYKIVRVADKIFIGTDILHVAIFKKNDTRTIYNVVYRDGKAGVYYMKRFSVTGVARDKEYDLTQGKAGSKVAYFTANPNGEAEVIRVQLKPALHLKKVEVNKDLSELAVKSRTARGNVLTKYEVKSITLKQKGHSTLGGRKVWFDPDVLRLNYDGQGTYLGEFVDDDRILVITNQGDYYLNTFELTAHFDKDIRIIEKYKPEKVWSLVQWNAKLGFYYAKRFTFDAQARPQRMVGESEDNRLVLLSDREDAVFRVTLAEEWRTPIELVMSELIEAKTPRVKGRRITTLDIARIEDITPEPEEPEEQEEPEEGETPESGEQETTTPEPAATEVEPSDAQEENPEDGENNTSGGGTGAGDNEEPAQPVEEDAQTGKKITSALDVPFTITNEVPESSRPAGDQLSLF